MVEDHAGLADSFQVTIWLHDINDNAPLFSQFLYTATMHEAASPVMQITTLEATDPDLAENGRVTYYLTDQRWKTFFTIDQSGNLKLIASPEVEVGDIIYVYIEARDHGSPRQSSTTVVKIEVTGKTIKPRLDNSFYDLEIRSDANESGEAVGVLTASGSSVVTYKLTPESDLFVLDPETGVLSLNPDQTPGVYQSYILEAVAVDDSSVTSE